MRITRVETLSHSDAAVVCQGGTVRWTWVRIHTDTGVVGTGETYPCPEVEEAVVHARLAPLLLGQDPLQIEGLWRRMFQALGGMGRSGDERHFSGGHGTDISGKACGRPVYELLGGKVRDRIRTYNTCYDDLHDFNKSAGKLARSLLDEGIRGMKIWPFDAAGEETGGQYITPQQMEQGLEPVRQIREEVGREMDIMMEFHGYWNLPCAERIAHALEPYDVAWLEDMLLQEKLSGYRTLRQKVRQPVVVSERLMGRWAFADLLELDAASIVMFDVSWCGGLSEARKIGVMADARHIPVAPHNCGGPFLHLANLHLCSHLPNLFIMESVRRHYGTRYPDIVTCCPRPEADSSFSLPPAPGLGAELRPEFIRTCQRRVTEA